MPRIFLNDEQAKLLRSSLEPVELCDSTGNVLVSMSPLADAELIRRAKERAKSPGPWHDGKAIQEHLHALQEAWDREGGFDENRMFQILHELRAQGNAQ